MRLLQQLFSNIILIGWGMQRKEIEHEKNVTYVVKI